MKNISSWLIVLAYFGFQVFNYSVTHYALIDLLGTLSLGPVLWATILSIAFCGIDFAGIARLFTPETPKDEPAEIWILFAAWFLAAALNATLTWWGFSLAFLGTSLAGTGAAAVIALVVFVVRVIMINIFSTLGEKIISIPKPHYKGHNPQTEYYTMYQSEIPQRTTCPFCGTYLTLEESELSKCPYCGGSLNPE